MSSILVLDDRATERKLLITVLGYLEHTMFEASTGAEALGLARTHRPDLIMADLMMPGMNGYEFVRELRADPELGHTRVVFCTATFDELEVRTLAESCGVVDILIKPCEPEEIIRVVSAALGSDEVIVPPLVPDEFDREQLRVLNAKLIQKVDELESSKRLVEAKAEQLAVSLKYKSEFFANMSHELRTPLNSVLILAGLLQDNIERNLTAKQIQFAEVIQSSGVELLALLDDIMELADAESGTATLEVGELALADVRADLRREFEQSADRKGVSFSIELADGLPATIATDPARLLHVLRNLVANAFKFTERGAVSVRIGLADGGWSAVGEELSQAGTAVAFRISDTGIGMTAATQAHIFEDFVQGDGTTARQYGGTGLGLSSSRRFVALLGGEITVTSTPGEGSTFTVYLPDTSRCAGASVPLAAVPVAPGLPPPRPRPNVLLVDDDPRNILALTAVLERAGFRVIAAGSGMEGVAILGRTPDIDIALVDIMMPDMDGYATIRAMRGLPRGQRIPIFAVTAKVGGGEIERCLDAGASAYVSKPVDIASLLCLLTEWVPALSAA